jgi:hypothetical protein
MFIGNVRVAMGKDDCEGCAVTFHASKVAIMCKTESLDDIYENFFVKF